jgi:hypothetical protein
MSPHQYQRIFISMFVPSTPLVSPIDPTELNRIKDGRPASRTEILDRHLREHRITTQPVTIGQPIQVDTRKNVHGTPVRRNVAPASPNPVAKVRRGISRALITAGQRIGPEAA